MKVFRLPEYIVADAGYGSEENYVDIIENRRLTPLITYGMYLKEQEKRYKDVEPVFGFLKANLRFNRFTLRGKVKTKIEMGLALMAVNLRKYTQRMAAA